MYIPFIIILTRHFQSQKKIQQKRTTTSLVTERKLKVLKVFFHMKKKHTIFFIFFRLFTGAMTAQVRTQRFWIHWPRGTWLMVGTVLCSREHLEVPFFFGLAMDSPFPSKSPLWVTVRLEAARVFCNQNKTQKNKVGKVLYKKTHCFRTIVSVFKNRFLHQKNKLNSSFRKGFLGTPT